MAEYLDDDHRDLEQRLKDITNADIDFSDWEEQFIDSIQERLKLQGNKLELSQAQKDSIAKIEAKIERVTLRSQR